jgi:hypothetical protein
VKTRAAAISVQPVEDEQYARMLRESLARQQKEAAALKLERRKEREAALPADIAPLLVAKYTISAPSATLVSPKQVFAHTVKVRVLAEEQQLDGPDVTPGGWRDFWLAEGINQSLPVVLCGGWDATLALITSMEADVKAGVPGLGPSPLDAFVSRTVVVVFAITGPPPSATQLEALGVKQVWPPVVLTTCIGKTSKGSTPATSCLLVVASLGSEVWAAGDLTGVADRKAFLRCTANLPLPPMQHVAVQLKWLTKEGEEDMAPPGLSSNVLRLLGLEAFLQKSRFFFCNAPGEDEAPGGCRRTVVVLSSGAQRGAEALLQACECLKFYPACPTVMKLYDKAHGNGAEENESREADLAKFEGRVAELKTIFLEGQYGQFEEQPPESKAVRQQTCDYSCVQVCASYYSVCSMCGMFACSRSYCCAWRARDLIAAVCLLRYVRVLAIACEFDCGMFACSRSYCCVDVWYVRALAILLLLCVCCGMFACSRSPVSSIVVCSRARDLIALGV